MFLFSEFQSFSLRQTLIQCDFQTNGLFCTVVELSGCYSALSLSIIWFFISFFSLFLLSSLSFHLCQCLLAWKFIEKKKRQLNDRKLGATIDCSYGNGGQNNSSIIVYNMQYFVSMSIEHTHTLKRERWMSIIVYWEKSVQTNNGTNASKQRVRNVQMPSRAYGNVLAVSFSNLYQNLYTSTCTTLTFVYCIYACIRNCIYPKRWNNERW